MCLYNFCGITWSGDNCDDNIGIDNCVRSESIFIKDTYYENCLTCNSSYYRVSQTITVDGEDHTVYNCMRKFLNSLTVSFFSPTRNGQHKLFHQVG